MGRFERDDSNHQRAQYCLRRRRDSSLVESAPGRDRADARAGAANRYGTHHPALRRQTRRAGCFPLRARERLLGCLGDIALAARAGSRTARL